MTLRFGSVRVPTTVHWPRARTRSLAGSLAFVLSDELSPAARWLENAVVVGIAGGGPGQVQLAALRWAAEHAAELGADGDRILVAGGARAARLALWTRDSGWPALCSQLLVHPTFTAEEPMPVNVAGAPPATVVCDRPDDGSRYCDRLRAAGIPVQEVRDDDLG